MRVLFVYPNCGSELRIPLAIAILISAIRKAGHKVRLFDSTFMGEFHTDNEAMAKLGTHKDTNLNDLVGQTHNVDPKEELKLAIHQFKPDFICVSIVERNFHIARELLSEIDIPVIAGGIMPTIAPDYMIDQDWIDSICVGEGDISLPAFISQTGSENIWNKAISNPLRPLINMDDVPEQDWTDFDTRHLLKPFMGKIYRGGSFEFSRGCHKSCTFCVAPKLRIVQKGLGRYHRTKSPDIVIKEIEHKVKSHGINMVSFADTDFLAGVSKDTMKDFLTKYASKVNLPFTMQASIGQLFDEDILRLLRQAQCCAISVGIESGSPRIQRDVLKKIIPVDTTKRAFDLCRKHELRVTANYMIGLPSRKDSTNRLRTQRTYTTILHWTCLNSREARYGI